MPYSLAELAILSFAVLLLWAAASDAVRYIIPNRVCLGIVLLYPAYALAAPAAAPSMTAVGIAAAVGIAVAVLVVGAFAFARGWCGGGDVKLLAAAALWAGPDHLTDLFFVMAMAGGAIALAMMAWQSYGRWAPALGAVGRFAPAPDWKPELPYGIAVAAGGLHVAATLLAIN